MRYANHLIIIFFFVFSRVKSGAYTVKINVILTKVNRLNNYWTVFNNLMYVLHVFFSTYGKRIFLQIYL